MTDEQEPVPNPRRRKVTILVWSSLLALVIVGAVTGYRWVASRYIPPLNQAHFETAQENWKAHGPRSYRLEVLIGGWQPGRIEAMIENGEVTSLTRDGITPKRKETWSYWTVDSLLGWIEEDLFWRSNPAQMAQQFHVPENTPISLSCEFDPVLGVPLRYRRAVSGTNLDVEWSITRLEPLPINTVLTN